MSHVISDTNNSTIYECQDRYSAHPSCDFKMYLVLNKRNELISRTPSLSEAYLWSSYIEKYDLRCLVLLEGMRITIVTAKYLIITSNNHLFIVFNIISQSIVSCEAKTLEAALTIAAKI